MFGTNSLQNSCCTCSIERMGVFALKKCFTSLTETTSSLLLLIPLQVLHIINGFRKTISIIYNAQIQKRFLIMYCYAMYLQAYTKAKICRVIYT